MEGKDKAVLTAMIAILSKRTMARASGMITIQRCYRLKLQGWYPQLCVKETMLVGQGKGSESRCHGSWG